jgi:mitogen-activated protein kinase 1/3
MTEVLESTNIIKRPRLLTDHVCSRWYRAPELILVENQYDQAVDMWGTGCVLGEFIHCSQPYVGKDKFKSSKDLKKYIQTRISYPGTSCYPLSPSTQQEESKNSETNIIADTDQLI